MLAKWYTEKPSSLIGTAEKRLLVIQAVHPGGVIAAEHQLVVAVVGKEFILVSNCELDLVKIVDMEVEGGTPVLLWFVDLKSNFLADWISWPPNSIVRLPAPLSTRPKVSVRLKCY